VKWTHSNIVDEVIHRAGLRGLTHLAEELGATKQKVWNWKARNSIPKTYYLKVRDLAGIELEELLQVSEASPSSVTMAEFLADVPRYIELARTGKVVNVAVNGRAVFKMSPP
jgi:hypothetical protein